MSLNSLPPSRLTIIPLHVPSAGLLKARGEGFEIGGNKIEIGFTGLWASPKSSFDVGRTQYPEYRKAVDTLEKVGGLFRFREDPD